MNLFDFIYKNIDTIIGEKGFFSRDTWKMIRAILTKNFSKDMDFTEAQRQLLLTIFVQEDCCFNALTPDFILEDSACFIKAIKVDINSIDFVKKIDSSLEAVVIEEALKQDFSLKESSPQFLKENYLVACHSIKCNVLSADYVCFESLNLEQKNTLFLQVIDDGGYVLSDTSPDFFRRDPKLVLASIKKDINSIRYVKVAMTQDFLIFKYLFLNDYELYYPKAELTYLQDREIMDFYIAKLHFYDNKSSKFIHRFGDLFHDALNEAPTIESFFSIFEYVALEEWQVYRKFNLDKYGNIFGKICGFLQKQAVFDVTELYFLVEMQEVLGDKYVGLYQAMEEYFKIYHSNDIHKLEKLQPSKDKIAQLSALYVSKAKELFLKDQFCQYTQLLYPYFTIKMDSLIVRKKIILIKQKEKFRELYQKKDQDVTNFIDGIVLKYQEEVSLDIVRKMVQAFLIYDISSLAMILLEPLGYLEYLEYLKVKKLINRLNSKYIQIEDDCVFKYREVIQYDVLTDRYVYIGKKFTKEEEDSFLEYQGYERIFAKIKKEIMIRVKGLEIDNLSIDEETLADLVETLPFLDEHFEFVLEDVLKKFNFDQFMNECLGLERGYNEDSFLLDRCYDSLYHLFVSNGLFWLLLILGNSSYRKNMVFKSHGIHLDNIFQLINHLPSMVSVAHLLGVDLTDFSCLISIHKNIECMDDLSLAILGENMIDILCRRLEFTNRDELEVVRKARELVSLASKRTCSTVPYIEGDCLNYHYAMYDHLDNDVLLSGILTDACFRIDGNDNDFFHYCVLNKNGFVIKITDYAGNFIARGSGFRNGNIVYVNQLRTIYDSSDNHYCGEYLHEQKDIIETFRKACFDIVNISQENDNEVSKIDFVFVTQSYSLKILDSNVAVPVADKIGNSLIDEASLDWKHFVENTPNLFESSDGHQFNTDYGNYPIICMASSKRVEDIGCNDIRLGDVFALYQRKRGDISIFLKNDSLLVKRLNKLKAIQAYYKKDKFQAVVIPAGAMTFMGDNWFIIWYQGEIVDCCLLEEDNAAKMEFRSVLEVIQNNSSDYSHLLKLEQELALVFDAKVKARILKRD